MAAAGGGETSSSFAATPSLCSGDRRLFLFAVTRSKMEERYVSFASRVEHLGWKVNPIGLDESPSKPVADLLKETCFDGADDSDIVLLFPSIQDVFLLDTPAEFFRKWEASVLERRVIVAGTACLPHEAPLRAEFETLAAPDSKFKFANWTTLVGVCSVLRDFVHAFPPFSSFAKSFNHAVIFHMKRRTVSIDGTGTFCFSMWGETDCSLTASLKVVDVSKPKEDWKRPSVVHFNGCGHLVKHISKMLSA